MQDTLQKNKVLTGAVVLCDCPIFLARGNLWERRL